MAENTTETHTLERCYKHVAPNPPPLIQNGSLHIQTHHIGFIVSGAFAVMASIVSFWLISKHLQWYHNKREQRYIVRLLFMVPLYAVISFASFFFWNQATPLVLVRDAYESIVLTAFFYLLLMYLSHDPEEQKRIFLKRGLSKQADRNAIQRGVPLQQWCFPLGFIKWKPADGLYFLQLMKWAVLQYCVIRPVSTLASVVLDNIGLYCEASWSPGWGHIWLVLVVSISVSVAMYCLIQLYVVVGEELAPHQPLLKLFSVKAVVFLTFWQATLLGVLAMFSVIKATQYMTVEDVNIGIGTVLETSEMMLFAFLHIKAFTYKPYKEIAVKAARRGKPECTPQWRALGHAMDFRETFREIWVGCKYMFDKMRGKEPKYDRGAMRNAHYEVAFGRSRFQQPESELVQKEKKIDGKELGTQGTATLPVVEIEVDKETEVDLDGSKQWLGLGKHERYGLHPQREKSEGLEAQINYELERRGLPQLSNENLAVPNPDYPPKKAIPWWRSLYDRISQSGPDPEGSSGSLERESFLRRSTSKRLFHRVSKIQTTPLDFPLPEDLNPSIDDHPPRSLLKPFYKARPPRSPTYVYDHDFIHSPSPINNLDEDSPMLPLAYVGDGYSRVNGKRDYDTRGRYPANHNSPPQASSSPSRNLRPKRDSKPPQGNHTEYNRASIGAVYHDPYEASGPTSSRAPRSSSKKHQSRPPPRELKPAVLPSTHPPPRSWYVPSREALVFPAALGPNSPISQLPEAGPPAIFSQPYARSPQQPGPANYSPFSTGQEEYTPVLTPSKRRSVHRREAANPPLSPLGSPPRRGPLNSSSPSAQARYPGLPASVSISGSHNVHQAMYIKQPWKDDSPFNDPHELA
ncbi:organic solute transporter Ostalpha-domain-containing protein [Crepidotus variabilis]|uniref:Organic solute transporter Ostalpha-domain-containing protein n=1 Tax=Crepidotus variabilis TaxID=179855 RepID=A0A9P6JKN5_9AGAR|nr:organic solute transporter Ostalpha-domain-containing protein [Crepidotus variabilis]